jgi:hypothetical protein
MRNLMIAGISTIAILATTAAFAEGKSIGKHSQDEIRGACNAAGGELLGVSDLGSYGCEVASSGAMILCNKSNDCTAYSSARTRGEQRRVMGVFKLSAKAASRQ